MTDAELLSRAGKAFLSVFGKRVAFDTSLSRLTEASWTSLKHVELLIALEEEFGVRFDGADATDMTSVALVLERVRRKLP